MTIGRNSRNRVGKLPFEQKVDRELGNQLVWHFDAWLPQHLSE
jgi:hypothetical protein